MTLQKASAALPITDDASGMRKTILLGLLYMSFSSTMMVKELRSRVFF